MQELNGKEIVLFARSIAPSLGNKEKRIISFISNNYDELTHLTITGLAKHLEVSEASITKACKKLKCNGFHQLKKKLQEYMKKDDTILKHEEEDEFYPSDKIKTITEKVFIHSIVALQDTLSGIDMDQFEQAADLLIHQSQYGRLLLFGSGGSGILCEDFQHKLLKVGITAIMFRDANMQLMSAALVKEEDIVIGISHSGKTRDVLECLKLARMHGARTICITNHAISPITEIAEISLYSSARNSPLIGENAAARIAQLNILDALYSTLVVRKNKVSFDNLNKTKNSVQTHRTAKRRS